VPPSKSSASSGRTSTCTLSRSNIELRGLSWGYAGLGGVVIFVDYSHDDGFSADMPQVGHVPDGLHFDFRWPLPPGLVRPVAVAMGQVPAEHQVQMAFAEDQDPVQQFAAEGPDDSLADGVGARFQQRPVRMISTGVCG
jgi:hypothetical protein